MIAEALYASLWLNHWGHWRRSTDKLIASTSVGSDETILHTTILFVAMRVTFCRYGRVRLYLRSLESLPIPLPIRSGWSCRRSGRANWWL